MSSRLAAALTPQLHSHADEIAAEIAVYIARALLEADARPRPLREVVADALYDGLIKGCYLLLDKPALDPAEPPLAYIGGHLRDQMAEGSSDALWEKIACDFLGLYADRIRAHTSHVLRQLWKCGLACDGVPLALALLRVRATFLHAKLHPVASPPA